MQGIDWAKFLQQRAAAIEVPDSGKEVTPYKGRMPFGITPNFIDKPKDTRNPQGNTKTPIQGNGNPNRTGSYQSRGGYGATGIYPGIDPRRPKKIVSGQIRELLRSLRNERKGVRRETSEGIRDIDLLNSQTQSGLDNISQQVQAYMAAQGAQINQNYADLGQQTGAQDAALQQQMQTTNTEQQAAAMAEMERLGIQQTGIDPMWSANNAAQMQAAQQVATNNQNNIQAGATGASAISGLMGQLSAGTFGSFKGQANLDRQSAINELGDDSRSAISDIMAEMRNTRKSKGDAINELMEQMLAGDYERWANTNDMQFQHMDSNRQFANQRMMQRLGLLQSAAGAQAGSSAWQQAYVGNPFPGLGNPYSGSGSPSPSPSPFIGPPTGIPGSKPKRKKAVRRPGDRDNWKGGLWE